jgi:hypothetical protein
MTSATLGLPAACANADDEANGNAEQKASATAAVRTRRRMFRFMRISMLFLICWSREMLRTRATRFDPRGACRAPKPSIALSRAVERLLAVDSR